MFPPAGSFARPSMPPSLPLFGLRCRRPATDPSPAGTVLRCTAHQGENLRVKHPRFLLQHQVLILISTSLGLVVACAPSPAPIRVAPPPEAAGSSVIAGPPIPAVGAVVAVPAVVGRPQYQLDAQHSGRSPYAGPS